MKRNIVIATVAAAALIGGGAFAASASGDDDSAPVRGKTNVQTVADDRDDFRDDNRRDDDRDDDSRDDTPRAATADVTAADAVAAALKHTSGTAVSVDLEDDGADHWEVEVVKSDGTEYTVRVAPDTGKALGAQRDDDSDGRDELAALRGTTVTAEEAARAAAAKGTVVEVDLDDDGPAVWSVETTQGEWTVDAKTSTVTQERDDD
ncbi:Peptidase propeptide and YPEB domain-containing protein [Streptomyces sp. DI166]|uniref:PepSY domain-containing protein n=1 Tax=Streptomyces sp. DI166 TaxID=1839783 RepID=UPI0007F40A2D|nr:PepSY domain-containing protein [Streptomyces sp. DI166]SBT90509.1 Peptidase propeptide and YPEB domain-containing protein [Streptomyces sp. DI166]